jgi:hypothetical protein
MGAMLLARSATASTGRRNAGSEPQPEPLILGLVPDQPAPGARSCGAISAMLSRTARRPSAFLAPFLPSARSLAALFHRPSTEG